MEKNISLSQHISIKLDETDLDKSLVDESIVDKIVFDKEIINEGLLDSVKSLFSGVGAVYANLKSSLGGDKKENKVLAEMKNQMKLMKEEEKKKMDEFKKSKENKLVEKIKAKYALKKQQMSLKWNKKIKEQESIMKRYQNEAKFFASDTRIYTPSEMQAIEAKLDNDFTEIDPTKMPEGAEKIKENLTLILRKPGGTMRTQDELADFIKNDTEGQALWAELETGVDANSANIVEALQSGEFKDYVKDISRDASDRTELETQIAQAEEDTKTLKAGEASVAKFAQMKADYDEQKKKVDAFGTEPITKDNVNSVLAAAIDEETDIKKIKEKLQAMGLDSKQIKAICEGSGDGEESVTVLSAEEIKARLNGDTSKGEIDDAILSGISDNVKAKKSSEESKLSDTPNPMDPDSAAFKLLSEEDQQAIEAGKEIVKRENNGSIPDDENFATRVGEIQKDLKTEREAAEEHQKRLNDKKEDYENEETAKQQQAVEAHANASQRKVLKELTDEQSYKEIANSEDKDLEAGETKKDGKVGYYDEDGKFHQKPEVGDKEGWKAYEEGRKAELAKKPLTAAPKIKKDPDNEGKYIITEPDGTTRSVDKSEAAKILANSQKIQKERAEIEAAKANVLSELKKMDNKKLKELRKIAAGTGPEAEAAKAKLAVLDKAINDKDFFKDAGSISQDNATAAIKHITDNDLDFDFDDNDGDEENTEEIEDKDGNKKSIKDLDDAETDEEEDDPDNPGQKRKKKIENPAKIWHRKKKKNGAGSTTNYYNSNGDSISPQVYKEKIEHFKAALKKKNESSLSRYIANLLEAKSRINNLKSYFN